MKPHKTKALIKEKVNDLLLLGGYRSIKSISFWLTYLCVHHCDYCLCPDSNEVLGKERYYALMEEALPMGLTSIGFTGGDPALHPDLEEIVEHALGCKLTSVMLASTGFKLSEKLLEKWIKTGNSRFHIFITINSHIPEVNDLMRGPGGFDATVSLARQVKGLDGSCFISINVDKRNVSHFDRTADFIFKELDPQSLNIILSAPVGRYIENAPKLMLDEEEMNIYYSKLTEIIKKWGPQDKPIYHGTMVFERFNNCFKKHEVIVLPDGSITQCCYALSEDLLLANRSETLKKALSFSRRRGFLKAISPYTHDMPEQYDKWGFYDCYNCALNQYQYKPDRGYSITLP